MTVSDYSRNSIEKNFGIPLSRIHITPNAVLQDELPCEDLDVKAKYNIEKYILSVSRIEPRKNHLALLKAFVDSRLYEKGFKLFFVGVPDLTYKSFSRYYSELSQNIKNSILFESVSYNELIALYRKASLFVFPSFAEGFGIPPLEAIENNCPVLCSNTTAMAEFDLPKEWIFSPIDQEELKKKMVKLLENKPLLDTVKQKLRKKFSWEASASVLYNLLISNFCKSV